MKNIKKIILILILILAPVFSVASLNIVTTTEDLAAIAREVGGDLVEVNAIAKGYQDPHFVDAKPSYMLKLKKADLFIEVGLELEVGWAPALLIGARNVKILPGGAGFLDASTGINILEKGSSPVDRSMGDVHPFGNPHYWLDPRNGSIIADNIYEKLIVLLPAEKEKLAANTRDFKMRLADKLAGWKATLEKINNIEVLAYHNTWTYFSDYTGFKVVGYVEPKPGIPPAPAHVNQLINLAKSQKIPLIVVDPYFDHKLPNKISESSGAKLVELAPSVGAFKEIKTYFDLFDFNIQKMAKELK